MVGAPAQAHRSLLARHGTSMQIPRWLPGRLGSSAGQTSRETNAARRRGRQSPLTVHAVPPELDLAALEVPELDAGLTAAQAEAGAVFDDDGVVVTFANESRALHALAHGAALADRSHDGRLRVTGAGRLRFLHGQSTADVQALRPGQGCYTVFANAQGRALDLATVFAQANGLLLLVSSGTKEALLQRLNKHIFPGDEVELSDVSGRTSQFSLIGPDADAITTALGAGAVVGRPEGEHILLGFSGRPVLAASGSGLASPGYTFVADEAVAAELWTALVAKGAEPMGADAWEVARVEQGRPAPCSELSEDYNALEAGLGGLAVSLNKGCYVGQETLAKVFNRSAVKQQLWGLTLEAPCCVGDDIFMLSSSQQHRTGASASGVESDTAVPSERERPLGRVTSYADLPSGGHRALAYLRCRGRDGTHIELEGAAVMVAGSAGRVVAPPFLRRELPPSAQPGGGRSAADSSVGTAEAGSAAESSGKHAEAEAARREEKLRALQARLAAWQQQQPQ